MLEKYKIGQEWSYETRPNETNSTFIIVHIDEGGIKGKILHLYIKNLKMKNKLSPTGFNDHIIHLPCSEECLNLSNCKLKHENSKIPNFKEGYLAWLKAFEEKKAGVFQVKLSEIIDSLESIFNR